MIGYLKGKIIDSSDKHILVECGPIGYKVEMGRIDYLDGQEVELFIHTHVREQELRLFGFKTQKDLELFDMLISVSGVGPKAGMSLVSELGFDRIVDAISSDNPAGLKVSGVGKKTAERLIIELKNKVDATAISSSGVSISGDIVEEAIGALEGLGYTRIEISDALAGMSLGEGWGSEDIIKALLKELKKNLKVG